MRPMNPADPSESCHLSLITDHYLRYILIRALAYTDDRTRARRIAAGTLVWSGRLAGRLRGMADLGWVIEMVEWMIGKERRMDLGAQSRMRDWSGSSLRSTWTGGCVTSSGRSMA